MATIKVHPNKPTAVGLPHPHGPVLTKDGALWPNDSFTARRLADGSVVRAPAAVSEAGAPPPEPSSAA